MDKEINKIILPVDGSECAKKAAKKAFFIAKNIDAGVSIICVLDPFRYATTHEFFPSFNKIRREEAVKYLEEIEQIGINTGVKCLTRLIDGGTPVEEIIKSASPNDLIVMGIKGHSNIERILIGGVSEKVVRHAKCSVMVVR